MENTQAQEQRNTQAHYGDPEVHAGYEALKEGAALVDHPGRAVFRLAGRDPVGMLGAVLTNEMPKEANRGAYASLLNPKGRIQADLRVLKAASGCDILVDTEPAGAEAVREILGRYAPFSRVKIEDLSDGEAPSFWGVLGLYGPRASALLGDLPQLDEHETAEAEIGDVKALAAGVTLPVPGLDLLGPAEALRAAREYLIGAGAVPASPDAYETARVRAGVPRFGADLTPENFPGESQSFLERAVSFQKGCYPGQETVARMHYRGSPNKKLYRFVAEGPIPEPGDEILQGQEQQAAVGHISSVTPLAVEGQVFTLGYLSRKADPSGPLNAGGTALRVLGEA